MPKPCNEYKNQSLDNDILARAVGTHLRPTWRNTSKKWVLIVEISKKGEKEITTNRKKFCTKWERNRHKNEEDYHTKLEVTGKIEE